MPRRRLAVPSLALLVAFALGAAAASVAAEETAAVPDPASKEAVAAHLEKSRALFLGAIAGLTPEQWAWKPAPERWSVGECAEHLARAEPFLRELAREAITQPVTAEELAKSHGKSATVLGFITDRSQRFNAPEGANPMTDGKVRTRAEVERDFNYDRGRTAELAFATADLTAYAKKHFGFQELDLAGWLYFLSGHTERHTLQIEEVKATAGFPKG